MGTVLILNNENFKVKVEQTNFVTHLIITAVPDPDLEIRSGGGHPDPYIRGGGGGH